MDLIIIGGGCYGCYHTRQLLKAQHRGKIAARRFVVVDRNPACRALGEFAGEPLIEVVRADWATFLRRYLDDLPADTPDRIVPAPFAPHLFCDWLLDTARADLPGLTLARGRCELALGLPYEHSDAAGNRFISAAGWLCPVTCIEPARCPAIHAERTWELGEIVTAGAARAPQPYASVALFTCRHFAFGVGAIPAAALVRARRELAATLRREGADEHRTLVGTVSACHGVLGELVAHSPKRKRANTGR